MLNEEFWTERYRNQQTGWDIGYPSTPLQKYFEQLSRKDIHILIPGCGNAYEAEFLVKKRLSKYYSCGYFGLFGGKTSKTFCLLSTSKSYPH